MTLAGFPRSERSWANTFGLLALQLDLLLAHANVGFLQRRAGPVDLGQVREVGDDELERGVRGGKRLFGKRLVARGAQRAPGGMQGNGWVLGVLVTSLEALIQHLGMEAVGKSRRR